MKITRVQALVIGIAALAVLGVAAAAVYILVIDREELRYPTQSALRESLDERATAELQTRGVTLTNGLTCKDMHGWSKTEMRATCYGSTDKKEPVRVYGTGSDETHDHYYTILVSGKPLVENASCLGADCRTTAG